MTSNDVEPYDQSAEQIEATRGDLSPTHRIACALWACGKTDVEVAAECKVATSTARAWRQKPAFQAEINRCVEYGQRNAVRKVYALMPRALEELAKLLDAPETGPGSLSATQRLQAIKLVMDRLPTAVAFAVEPESVQVESKPARDLTPLEEAAANATLLEVLNVYREIEEMRARPIRVIPGELDDEDEGDFEDDEPSEVEPARAPEARRTPSRGRPKVTTTQVSERELARMRGRGAAGGLGGSRIVG